MNCEDYKYSIQNKKIKNNASDFTQLKLYGYLTNRTIHKLSIYMDI